MSYTVASQLLALAARSDLRVSTRLDSVLTEEFSDVVTGGGAARCSLRNEQVYGVLRPSTGREVFQVAWLTPPLMQCDRVLLDWVSTARAHSVVPSALLSGWEDNVPLVHVVGVTELDAQREADALTLLFPTSTHRGVQVVVPGVALFESAIDGVSVLRSQSRT